MSRTSEWSLASKVQGISSLLREEEKMSKLAKGMRVKQASKPEWGVGQLLEDANGEYIRVFFTGNGEVQTRPELAALLQLHAVLWLCK